MEKLKQIFLPTLTCISAEPTNVYSFSLLVLLRNLLWPFDGSRVDFMLI